MDKLERLAYWKCSTIEAIRAADRDGAAWLEKVIWKSEDDLFAFFDCFRPDGSGLDRVFAGVVCGDEILTRLLKVFACTRESFKRYAYFIVCRPAHATPEKLLDLTARHLDKVRQIARSGQPEWMRPEPTGDGALASAAQLASWLDPLPRIELTHAPRPQQNLPDYEAPETLVNDVVGDWFLSLEPVESDALLMKEAFYSIACDYYIANHLMWPLYRHATAIEEPFAPYFELWTHGAQPCFEEPGRVAVYVTDDR